VLRSFTIGQKLVLSSFLVLLLAGVLSGLSLLGIGKLTGIVEYLTASALPDTQAVAQVRLGVREAQNYAKSIQFDYLMKKLVKTSGAKESSPLANCTACHSVPAEADSRKEFAALAARITASASALRGDATGSVRSSLDRIAAGLTRWQNLFASYLEKSARDDFDGAHAVITDQMEPELAELEKAIATLEKGHQKALEASAANARAAAAGTRWGNLAAAVFGFAFGLGLFLIARDISRTLRRLATNVKQHAAGVFEAAGEIGARSRQAADRITARAARLEQTSSASEEISGAARRNTADAREMAQVVAGLHGRIAHTNRILEETSGAMRGISESASSIAQINKVIGEIAFQTNLLALNAAVEAARAGQAGQGFGVVAEEVRRLAQRCAEAANNTSSLIEEAVSRSTQGRTRMEELVSNIAEITAGTESIHKLAGRVLNGSGEQQEALQHISGGLSGIREFTAEEARIAESETQLAERLSTQSEALDTVTGELALMVGRSGDT
jgi:methyl-accepting chemotaxis protein